MHTLLHREAFSMVQRYQEHWEGGRRRAIVWEISTFQNKTNKQKTYKLLPSLINVTHSICNGKVRLGGDHYLGNWISK
jgi:hypothetical protein